MIDGADVTAITDRTAILRLRTGSVQVYHRQASTGAVPLWGNQARPSLDVLKEELTARDNALLVDLLGEPNVSERS